jgi:CheY-like chemotaxis protein
MASLENSRPPRSFLQPPTQRCHGTKEEEMMNKRILIVDDDAEILEMLKLTLSVWSPDTQVVLAANGLDALIRLQLHDSVQPFDIVLTDYDMPIMNGLDLAHEIRQRWPGIHIILMSAGQFEKNFQNNANLREYDGYIKKPFIMQQVKHIFLTDPGILH